MTTLATTPIALDSGAQRLWGTLSLEPTGGSRVQCFLFRGAHLQWLVDAECKTLDPLAICDNSEAHQFNSPQDDFRKFRL